MVWCPRFGPRAGVCGRAAAQERDPLDHISIHNVHPPAIDRSHRSPVGKLLLGSHREQLVYPLVSDCMLSDERKQQGPESKADR